MFNKTLSALLILLFLCGLSLQDADWQAADNMTDYLPTLRGFMDAVIEDGLEWNRVASNITTSCNREWEDYWNVVVIWQDPNNSANAVLYGYAFRRHWYWHNSYGPDGMSFIVWKDYNCDRQISQARQLIQGFTIRGGVPEFAQAFDLSVADNSTHAQFQADVWQWARTAVEDFMIPKIANDYTGGDVSLVGVSLVLMTNVPLRFNSRFCYNTIYGYKVVRETRSHLGPKHFAVGFATRLQTLD